jgi:hypothetical protein
MYNNTIITIIIMYNNATTTITTLYLMSLSLSLSSYLP